MFDFHKTRRLLKKAEFEYVFRCGKRLVTQNFVIIYCENEKKFARIGFALSKRYIKKAYQRNHIKRLFRESFRHQNLSSIDIVVTARKTFARTDDTISYQQLGRIWEKLNIFGVSSFHQS